MKNEHGTPFVLVYLWFDVPGAPAAMRHRAEIEHFGKVLQRDGVKFVARTYEEVVDVLRAGNGGPDNAYVTYLLERYSASATDILAAA